MERQAAWRHARQQCPARRRHYFVNAAASLGFALFCALAGVHPGGLDALVRHSLGLLGWEMLLVLVAGVWALLGASYLWVAISKRPSPPFWWLPWVR